MDIDVAALVKENQQLHAEIAQLKATVNTLQQLLFGQKSERRRNLSASSHAAQTKKSDQTNIQTSGRRRLPDHLERVSVDHELPNE